MSATQYLNELETERLAIESENPRTPADRAAWWGRLAEWWHRRDLGFGDGKGMASHCNAMAEKCETLSKLECEFCGDPAFTFERFDRDVAVCEQCRA